MKATFFSAMFFVVSINGIAQKDSLKLRLSYEVSVGQAQLPLNVRLDFTSLKANPIAYQVKPDYAWECELDDIRLQQEVLDGSCYRAVVKSDCDPIGPFTRAKDNFRELRYGDTATYRDYIYLLDKERVS